ncbi:terminase TerL endonuclease subunit [Jeotgalibaca porci]|uniref:terminase TerL endonuclease subunit n=1 Tax=Jeotgalibaca porci TaxID=1868793 RepID=UPI0035A079A1
MLHSVYVDEYLEKWKTGKYVLCDKNIKLLEFLEREILPRDDIYYFNDEKIEEYINFSETWYFNLDDWEKFIVPFIFLFYLEDDEVVFDEFVIIVGRGAGKNGFVSTLSHYFISSLHGVDNYDITLVANSEKQAKRSFNDVRLTITKRGNEALNANPPPEYKEANPADVYGEFEGYKSRITSLETQSEIIFVAANSSTLDGGREGCVIYDEFHEMENSDIPDVLGGGIGKTQWGRQFFIGTKGFVRGGYFDEKYARCEAILNGDEEFNGIFPFINELDDIEEMDNPVLWPKANPTLQEPLTTRAKRLIRTMKKEYTELNYSPSKRPAFVTKRMNFIEGDMEHSVASKAELEATRRPYFEFDDLIPIGTLDYGSVRDFASCGLLFKKDEDYAFKQHSFVVKQFADTHYGYSNTANMSGGEKKAPIKKWEDEGYLSVMDEPSLNPQHIVQWFVMARDLYGVQKIVADNFKLDVLRPLLEAEGFEVDFIKRPQSIHPLVAPRIEDAFANGKIIFADDDMMRWYTNNVYVKETNVGKLFLKKEEVKRKTDGFQSLVHGMYRANELDEQAEFVLGNINF